MKSLMWEKFEKPSEFEREEAPELKCKISQNSTKPAENRDNLSKEFRRIIMKEEKTEKKTTSKGERELVQYTM